MGIPEERLGIPSKSVGVEGEKVVGLGKLGALGSPEEVVRA